jgi:hypothetical protein
MEAFNQSWHGNQVLPAAPHSDCNYVEDVPAQRGPTASHQVVPSPPARKQSQVSIRRALSPSFWEMFGVSSAPVLLVTLICLGWTAWLILLTVAPNETANFLMGTEDFDDGRFWMLIEENAKMKGVVIGALIVVLLGDAYVLVSAVLHRPSERLTWLQKVESQLARCIRGASSRVAKAATALKALLIFWRELVGFRGRYRKFWVRNSSVRYQWHHSSSPLLQVPTSFTVS